MLAVGRPRTRRKDLPPGLHLDRFGNYFYRAPKGDRRFEPIGKVDREAAIKRWVKITGHRDDPAADGTVAEIIDDFVADEIPRRLRLKKLAPATADGYLALAPSIRVEFGAFKYAKTPAESARPDVLRTLDVDRYLRRFEGKRGAILANRRIALLSVMFAWAPRAGICTYNPCSGAERNEERARKVQVDPAVRAKLWEAAPLPLRLIVSLSDVTSMRKTDVRLLMLSQVDADEIHVTPSKTKRSGRKLDFARTPAVDAILEAAKALPGRKISLYVFPTRKGTPYTESALQSLWRRAKKRAGLADVDVVFRDFRTTELNAINRAGGNATEAAGHADQRTTERHYLDEPTKITPRR